MRTLPKDWRFSLASDLSGLACWRAFYPPYRRGSPRPGLESCLPPGGWVLDPFGAAPDLAVEAARAGYRVVVAANNPVGRFLLDIAAQPPGEGDLQAALAELASARRGEERLEPYLRSLYQTHCAQCGQEVMAEAFLWSGMRWPHTPAFITAPLWR